MKPGPKNLGASVSARLLRGSRERGEDFQLVLLRYANERLLYRLASSRFRDRFVLKGATVFLVLEGSPHRATRDLDLLAYGEADEGTVRAVFEEIITLDVVDDGVRFVITALSVGPIRADQAYGGVRVGVLARLGSARIRLQVDVAFGDVMTPAAALADFPTLLEFPAPRLRVYPRETVVAEKLETMVKLGLVNSRMKDFYDVLYLSRSSSFDGSVVVRAIRATFERRGTPLPEVTPVALTEEFTTDPAKVRQWTAFVRKSGVSVGDLQSTAVAIATFALDPLAAAAADAAFNAQWSPGGPWVSPGRAPRRPRRERSRGTGRNR